jgi:predicted dehydrogenase
VIRIGFVGLGGAGQRHARILRAALGTGDQRWIGVRSRGTTPVLDAGFRPQPTSMAEAYGLVMTSSLTEALQLGIDLTVVATPTALHAAAAMEALAAGCPVLAEKPLATTAHEAEQLATLARARRVPLFAGFQRRFHPAWLQTVDIVGSGRLGRLLEVSAWARSNVADWHPYEPLDELYAVRQDLGGGAIRTECHELDQLVGLLGAPRAVSCLTPRPASLGEVEVEAEITLEYTEVDGPVRLSVSLESPVPQRGWRIVGSDGELSWDEVKGVLEVKLGTDIARHELAGFGNDDLVGIQDRWVLAHLTEPNAAEPGLAQAVATNAVIDAAHQALASGAAQPVAAP